MEQPCSLLDKPAIKDGNGLRAMWASDVNNRRVVILSHSFMARFGLRDMEGREKKL